MAEPRVRVLIVDDEPLARETLRLLMRGDADVEIVGECASGLDAVETIARLAPDLVFLDIQMPELDGFQTLARLAAISAARASSPAAATSISPPRPVIVFVTAYDRYALKAFDAHALDYLVKPFTDERFHEALARAKQHVHQRAFGALGERVLSLLRAQGLAVPEAALPEAAVSGGAVSGGPVSGGPLSDATPRAARAASRGAEPIASSAAAGTNSGSRPDAGTGTSSGSGSGSGPGPGPGPGVGAGAGAGTGAGAGSGGGAGNGGVRPIDRIAVKAHGRVLVIRTADIDWIEACDDHIRLHVGGASHELRQPLKELAARLDPRRFVRIHRSAIVNLDRVQELQPHFHGSYLVLLKNGASLPLSRTRRDELRAALGGMLP